MQFDVSLLVFSTSLPLTEIAYLSEIVRDRPFNLMWVIKVYTRKIESSCYCGKPDVFQNIVGCEAKRGRVKCSKWVHQSCKFRGFIFVMNIVTVDSATCIDISIVSFLNK
jgi:hypothetical protein